MRFVPPALSFLLLGAAAVAQAQQYVISTYAGGSPLRAPTADWDVSITADAAGNQYFAGQNTVFKRDQHGIVSRVAGNSRPGYTGDGGPATSAQLSLPWNLAVDPVGNLFIADLGNNRVRKVTPDGVITTVAGNGTAGFSGDGGPATSASLSPVGVAVDGAGNLFIGNAVNGISLNSGYGDNRVRKVSPDGIISTVAGGGPDNPGDGGPASSASLGTPYRVAVDRAGNLYIAEPYNGRIRKVSPDGVITTVAGTRKYAPNNFRETCTAGALGDAGPASRVNLCLPFSIAVDNTGNIFIGEFGYRCCYDIEDVIIEDFAVRQISPDGTITTVAGSHTPGLNCDCADVGNGSVAVDDDGNLYFSDSLRSLKISADGTVMPILDVDTYSRFSGDGGPATGAQLYFPTAVALDGAGDLFIADTGNSRVRRVSPDGIITTVAGTGAFGYSGDGGLATGAQVNDVTSVAADAIGNVFIADSRNNRIRKITPDGIITTVAGGGTDSPSDGGLATQAQLVNPVGVAVDDAGNLFITATIGFSSNSNRRVFKVSPDGLIATVAGGGQSVPGDGGAATKAALSAPSGLAVDGSGNLFIADGPRIRKVSRDGIITTVAGDGTFGFSSDGIAATSASVYTAFVAVDSSGNLFFPDNHYRIRKVSPDGIITTVAGIGPYSYPSGNSTGDGGAAATARLNPLGLAVDAAGIMYVADVSASAVRILRPTAQSVLIGAVVDAASQRPGPVSPGKMIVIYGWGLGPSTLVQAGDVTQVSFNGIAAPVLYASATQVAAVVPYEVRGTTAQVMVTYQGQKSASVDVGLAPSAPGLFTLNQTGAGQAAALNSDGTSNTALNPVKAGDSLTLYATGEGLEVVSGLPLLTSCSLPLRPILPVIVSVGGMLATVQCAGNQGHGVMQVTVQVPNGVQPGGYVPVVLKVGDASTTPGAVWIAVAGR